ncbi:MAG: hypothetical protein A3J28_05105 [Acidobacteria bacterium RIFCSPLOWO2_12_FULL_60_22]|nr:MAG: hypothetical protein A3J28_05105 [Acidobacteria bacterium RIFCSPLOWO2_12_FULL_60_22]
MGDLCIFGRDAECIQMCEELGTSTKIDRTASRRGKVLLQLFLQPFQPRLRRAGWGPLSLHEPQ